MHMHIHTCIHTYHIYLYKCPCRQHLFPIMIFTQHLNKSGVHLGPGVYFYYLPVQSRKTCASTGVYEFDSVVIGQHIYKHSTH